MTFANLMQIVKNSFMLNIGFVDFKYKNKNSITTFNKLFCRLKGIYVKAIKITKKN